MVGTRVAPGRRSKAEEQVGFVEDKENDVYRQKGEQRGDPVPNALVSD